MNATRLVKPHRVLVVTRNLPPLIGGMERLIWHIIDEFSKTAEVWVVGPEDSSSKLPDGVVCIELPLKPLTVFLARAKFAAMRLALELRPDLIFAGSGLMAPVAWSAAKASGARSSVYLHGLDIDTQHLVYRTFWRPFIRRSGLILVNSHFTRQIAIDAGMLAKHIEILHPGVELPDLDDSNAARRRFRQRHDLGNAPLVLYVGRITPRKGLLYFCDRILPTVIDRIPDTKLIVIGSEPANAILRQENELQRVRSALKRKGVGSRVLFLGEVGTDDPLLSEAYFSSNALVFPVQNRPHDNEGFGMVAVEAAAHGLPTVAFAAGGVPDAVSEGISGTLVAPGHSEIFAETVAAYLKTPLDKASADACRIHAESFAWTKFGQHLRKAMFPDSASIRRA